MTSMEMIRVTRTTARLAPVGESNGRCTHSDQVVQAARRLRTSGARLREVAAIAGCSISTAWRWTNGHRPAPARIVVKRVRHTPTGDQYRPPAASTGPRSGPAPAATPDLDFSELA